MKHKTKKVWLEIQVKDKKKYITGVYFGKCPPQNMMFSYQTGKKGKMKTAWLFDKHYIQADLSYHL